MPGPAPGLQSLRVRRGDISRGVTHTMPAIRTIIELVLAFLGAYFFALLFSLVVWTFRDIRSRTHDVIAQFLATLLVLVFNLPGLVLYVILRPKETLAQAYERSLEEEYLLQDIDEQHLCPGCKRKIQDDYMLCPNCHTELKHPCTACGRLLDLPWEVCPYCGVEVAAERALIAT